MSIIKLPAIIELLHNIQQAFICLGRLNALKVLQEGQYEYKLKLAANTFQFIQSALDISKLLNDLYAINSPHVKWPPDILILLKQRINTNGEIVPTDLDHITHLIENAAVISVNDCLHKISSQALYHSVEVFLHNLKQLLPQPTYGLSLNKIGTHVNSYTDLQRSLTGPKKNKLDDVFVCGESILNHKLPAHGNTEAEAAPYYWGLSARESMASDLCNLTLYEYDGMPIEFYHDMAKQAWDEMRHAVFCLTTAKNLISLLYERVTPDYHYVDAIYQYRTRGKGLPIPLEKNLYEAIWNATLSERLILMHHDTETPGIKRINSNRSSLLSSRYPDIDHGLEVIMREEATHARLGKKWLNYLFPSKEKLHNEIKKTRMLRGVLLLTSCTHNQQHSLNTMVTHVINQAKGF